MIRLLIFVALPMLCAGCVSTPIKIEPEIQAVDANRPEGSVHMKIVGGDIQLPGGTRGEMYLFHAFDLTKSIDIVHFVDGQREAVLTTLPAQGESWCLILAPDDEDVLRIFSVPEGEWILPLVPRGASV